jgi:hypothetical protein
MSVYLTMTFLASIFGRYSPREPAATYDAMSAADWLAMVNGATRT